MPKKVTYNLILAVVIFLLGFCSAFIILKNQDSLGMRDDSVFREDRLDGKFKFINPLLECEVGQAYLSHGLVSFKEDVVRVIDDLKRRNKISYSAVYFRDLNNGPWFGVNEQEPFYPASLLKVPVMMGVMKMAEQDPTILEKRLSIGDAVRNKQERYFTSPLPGIQADKSYSVVELLDLMIARSDNDAANMLLTLLGFDREAQLYQDLGLRKPDHFDIRNSITAKGYASFMRILFNASYLSDDMSELGLKILADSDFKDGLVAGLPEGTVAAHKFGEYSYDSGYGEPERQLHDCGVVYHPRKPYLICIMTRGDSFPDLAEGIKDISKSIYQSVDSQVTAWR